MQRGLWARWAGTRRERRSVRRAAPSKREQAPTVIDEIEHALEMSA